MARYLVTGAAGFIGARVTDMLLDAGHQVVGVDNLNDAYDVRVKHWRLKRLEGRPSFNFHPVDISDRRALQEAIPAEAGSTFQAIINLAARAGVRQSVKNPWVYLDTNITGTLGFAPGHFILRFSHNGAGQAIWGDILPLTSPAFSVSGTVHGPVGADVSYLVIEATNESAPRINRSGRH